MAMGLDEYIVMLKLACILDRYDVVSVFDWLDNKVALSINRDSIDWRKPP